MKKYQFETANMGTCEITVSGEWADGLKDLDVTCGDLCKEFKELDGGSVDEIFSWLIDEGVAFERPQSLWANARIVASAMIDGDGTVEKIIDRAGKLTADDLGPFLSDVAGSWTGDWSVSWQKDGDAGIDGESFRDPAEAVRCFFDVLDEYADATGGYTVRLGITWPDDDEGDCWDDRMFIRAKTY